MIPMQLSPLPIFRSPDAAANGRTESLDFVDDAEILRLITGPVSERAPALASHECLTAEDVDFAGWHTPGATPSPFTPAPQPPVSARPTPPTLTEPGLDLPHTGGHRWWIGGLAGALSTFILAALILTQSHRADLEAENSRPTGITAAERAPILPPPAQETPAVTTTRQP